MPHHLDRSVLILNPITLDPSLPHAVERAGGQNTSDPPLLSYIRIRICYKVVVNKYFLKRIKLEI